MRISTMRRDKLKEGDKKVQVSKQDIQSQSTTKASSGITTVFYLNAFADPLLSVELGRGRHNKSF
jgi:hypothetical protein